MSSIKPNKVATLSRTIQLIAGTNKHFLNGGQELMFGGVTRTVSATAQLLQSYVALRNATVMAQALARAKIATESAQAPPLLAIIDEYVAFVRASFGNQPDVLADFGVTPRKVRASPTAVQKATAVAKRAATRAARHTMGKDQKKSVKGAVSATLVVTPLDGSSARSSAPSPGGSGAPVSTPAGTTSPLVGAAGANSGLHVT